MKTRVAVLVCLACMWMPSGIAYAEASKEAPKKPEEKKTETKKPEQPKAEAHAGKEESKAASASETKGQPKKPEGKAAEGKPDVKEAEKREESERPSPLAHRTTPINRAARAPIRMPVRPRPAPTVATAAPAKSPAAPASPAPIIVEVRQEPARVEAVLHVVPYGQNQGVPAFAGAGYTLSPLNAPAYASAIPSMPMQQPDADQPGETTVGNFAPPSQTATYPPASYQPPTPRNVLRTPKNALTNEGLVMLAQVGYDEDFILDLMHMKTCRFDTSVEGLTYLATHGLTERVIRAALATSDNDSAGQGHDIAMSRGGR